MEARRNSNSGNASPGMETNLRPAKVLIVCMMIVRCMARRLAHHRIGLFKEKSPCMVVWYSWLQPYQVIDLKSKILDLRIILESQLDILLPNTQPDLPRAVGLPSLQPDDSRFHEINS
jgi:hypothetical protein